jgi:DNA-binding GntR family transcriptional regulator
MLLRDDIYRRIRHAILTCEFQPGQELREQALAERYRVSRSPIRDALLRLEQEDLVIVLPRQGYRVKPILTSEVETLFSFHLLMDPACAAAAARADDVALRRLNQFRGFADREYTEAEYLEYNASFHNAVAGLVDNKRLAAVVRNLIDQFDRLMWATLRSLSMKQSVRPARSTKRSSMRFRLMIRIALPDFPMSTRNAPTGASRRHCPSSKMERKREVTTRATADPSRGLFRDRDPWIWTLLPAPFQQG